MKRILFCTQTPLTKSLGAPKVILELAEEMRELGWECELRGRYDLDDASGQAPRDDASYRQRLHGFLRTHAARYDVVDYDHGQLPFARTDFAPQTLFVARSVLLAHHFDEISIPGSRSLKAAVRSLVCGRAEKTASRRRTQLAQRTLQEADLINVCSEDDKAALIRSGISEAKITVIPFGISRSRRPLFDAVSSAVPPKPTVAFVGTFDYRKGAREFPRLVQSLAAVRPDIHFRLLGTAGLFQTQAEVFAHFPKALHPAIEIIPRYAPEELPELLSSCSVGVFPSYIEGMPFGVLEMLAAALPVVAYNSPGPPMMLPPEYLVERGNAGAMSAKIAALLANEDALAKARIWAQERSRQFTWERSARLTSDIYLQNRLQNRAGLPASL